MAREIKTRFALEGEQKYKSAMKDAANSIKVLNSEQKLAKAQFQQTGDAEKYAAQSAEILRKKIEEQKTAVKAAEEAIKQLSQNGVAENSRQMQQWQTKLNDAQTALVKMQTDLQNLTVESETSAQSTNELGDSLESLNTKVSLEQVAGGVGKITSALESAVGKAKELATALVSELRESATWADDLATQALMYGLSVEELQRMRMTADLIDTDVESIFKSQQRFLVNVASTSKETQEAFRTLGIYTDKYQYGTFEDQVDLFWQAGESLLHLKNASEQAEIAQKLFGRSWHELVPLFSAGKQFYEETMAAQQVVSEDNVAKLTELDDSLQNLENRFETLKETVLAHLAPAFTQVSEAIGELLKQFNEYLATDEGQTAMQQLSNSVKELFTDLTNVNFETVLNAVRDALQKVIDALAWVKDNKDAVINAITGVVAAWGALKVTQGMITVIQLINGLKTLTTGSKIKELTNAVRQLSDLNNGGGGDSPVIPTTNTDTSPVVDGVKNTVRTTARSLVPNLIAGGAFLAATYEGAKFADAQYTQHVNDVANGVDQVAESAKTASDEVQKLGEQLKLLKDIYLEEKGAESFKDLDMSLISKVAPDSSLMDKVNYWGSIDKWLNSGEAVGAQAFSHAEDLIQKITEYINTTGKETVEEGAEQLGSEGVDQGVATGIEENTDVATEAANTLGTDVAQALNDTADEAYKAGEYVGEQSASGVASGIDSGIDSAVAAARRIGGAVSQSLRAVMKINSPSKVMEEIGQYVAMGFTQGMDSQLDTVGAAAERMAHATTGSLSGAGVRGGGMVDVTLMLGPERLTEVLVPLVNDGLGADLALERR